MRVCIGTDGNGMGIYKDVVGDLDIGATDEDKNSDTPRIREPESGVDAGSRETSGKDS